MGAGAVNIEQMPYFAEACAKSSKDELRAHVEARAALIDDLMSKQPARTIG